jgi:hypothetical protein
MLVEKRVQPGQGYAEGFGSFDFRVELFTRLHVQDQSGFRFLGVEPL